MTKIPSLTAETFAEIHARLDRIQGIKQKHSSMMKTKIAEQLQALLDTQADLIDLLNDKEAVREHLEWLGQSQGVEITEITPGKVKEMLKAQGWDVRATANAPKGNKSIEEGETWTLDGVNITPLL